MGGHPRRGRARARRARPGREVTANIGRLDVAPDAPAHGTQLRWSTPELVAAANAKVPDANVRTMHVLAPAPVKVGSATVPADPAQQTVASRRCRE
ncbi:hypothetical protein [Streptomyces sp. NPDC002671]